MEQASLESPLIMPSSHSMHKSLFACDDGREGTGRRGDAVAEMKQQLWLSGPLITSSLLQMALQIISVMFVGHLGELPLSGAAMATSFAGVTGFSLLMGMGSALDTLCGQSYGAKQYHLLGIHMQRAMLVLMLVSIPIAVVWAYAGQLLAAIGQDPEIALEAGLYARWLIPTIFAYGLLQCLARFLQTQSIVLPIMLCSGVTTLLHVLACWVLVFKSSLGSKGAALAISLSYWINMLLLVLYVKLSPACRKTWTGFSREALSGILGFVRLAIPSAVMVCMEFWAFELLVLLSGLLPNPNLETSVTAISLNTCELLFMIPFGLSAVVSIRVSNELGAGWPQAARLAVAVSVSLAVVQGSIVCLAMVLGRGVWGYAFSNEEGVVKYMEVMLPLLGAFKLVDGVQCVLSGVARGCGWQRIGAYINLGAYYTVGIPSAILLAFVFHIGGKGLWLGITGGIVVQMLLLITVTLCTNWEKEARKARDRHYSSTMPENMLT